MNKGFLGFLQRQGRVFGAEGFGEIDMQPNGEPTLFGQISGALGILHEAHGGRVGYRLHLKGIEDSVGRVPVSSVIIGIDNKHREKTSPLIHSEFIEAETLDVALPNTLATVAILARLANLTEDLLAHRLHTNERTRFGIERFNLAA